MNRATLIGNLAKDVELKTTPSGKSVATCSIATNRVYVDQQGQKKQLVQFHNLVIWGKPAEVFAKYLKKGSKLLAEGELQTRNWTGKDGIKRYTTEIIVNNFEFLSPASKPAESKPAAAPATSAPAESTIDFPEEEPSGDEEIRVENIPF